MQLQSQDQNSNSFLGSNYESKKALKSALKSTNSKTQAGKVSSRIFTFHCFLFMNLHLVIPATRTFQSEFSSTDELVSHQISETCPSLNTS